jgi:dUTP pyrophosphatase
MKLLKIKKLDPRAVLPEKASEYAACFDLRTVLDGPYVLQPGEFYSFHTGLAIEMPDPECVALIYSRSGMGAKHGISLTNSVGVIDFDYRGELIISLINSSSVPFTVEPGDRIAQMMVMKTEPLKAEFVEDLSSTERGSGGFGSTGKN